MTMLVDNSRTLPVSAQRECALDVVKRTPCKNTSVKRMPLRYYSVREYHASRQTTAPRCGVDKLFKISDVAGDSLGSRVLAIVRWISLGGFLVKYYIPC